MGRSIGACVAVAVLALGTENAAAAVRWSLQTAQLPSGSGQVDELRGVSCTSPTACTAVGDYEDGSGTVATLAERFDGARWSMQPTPAPLGGQPSILSSVSCTSSSACEAVGATGNFVFGPALDVAETWDGTSWSIQPTPSPRGNSAGLRSVSCVSRIACIAIGAPGVLGWDGQQWSEQDPGLDALAVSCSSSTACTAVTSLDSHAAALRWDGTGWTRQTVPTPHVAGASALLGVSCPSSRACTAVGYIQGVGDSNASLPLVERWNGTRWAMQAIPELPAAGADLLPGTAFDAVSCASERDCTAVGEVDYLAARKERIHALAAHWDGSSWSAATLPRPAREVESRLNGVSCTTGADCVAVGLYNLTRSYGCEPCFPLIERSSPAPAAWGTPLTVARVPDRLHPEFMSLEVGPTGRPVASWEQDDGVRWARRRGRGWGPVLRVPGDEIGGLYGAGREWTTTFGARMTVRRGLPGHTFGAPEDIGAGANVLEDDSETAPDGASLLVVHETPGGRASDSLRGRLLVTTRVPGRRFAPAHLLWRAPVAPDAWQAAIDDRGDGLIVWASRWSILAVRVSHGRIGRVRRLAPSGGRADWLDADIAGDGSALVAWSLQRSERALHVLTIAPSARAGTLRVLRTVTRSFPIDHSAGVMTLAEPGGGLVVWDGAATGPERVWAMAVRGRRIGPRRPLSAPGRPADWIQGRRTDRGAVAILWGEGRSPDGPPSALYAAERWRGRWIDTRQLVSDAAPVKDREADVAFDPCTARVTALWLSPASVRRDRIVSATGPPVGRPDGACG